MSGFCYEIKHKTNHNLMTYIGSTNNLTLRRHRHKSNCTNSNGKNYNVPLYQYIREHGGWENWQMNLIYEGEDYKKMEQDLIRDNYDNLLNKVIPNRTTAQYHEDNKEHILEKKKEYREKKKDHLREKVPCPHCDKFSTRTHLARHQKTQYCINYVAPTDSPQDSSSTSSSSVSESD